MIQYPCNADSAATVVFDRFQSDLVPRIIAWLDSRLFHTRVAWIDKSQVQTTDGVDTSKIKHSDPADR